jgi:hypothetical protein
MNTRRTVRTVLNYDELTMEDLSALHQASFKMKEEQQKYNPAFKFSINSYRQLRGHLRHFSKIDVSEEIIAEALKRLREKENACAYRERERKRERQDAQV